MNLLKITQRRIKNIKRFSFKETHAKKITDRIMKYITGDVKK